MHMQSVLQFWSWV